MSILGNHLYQCSSWHCCKRLCLASVNFFEDSFNVFAHVMMGDLWVCLLAPCWVFSSFGPKTAWPSGPNLPIHPILPWETFFCSPEWKSPEIEIFCWCRRGETKKMAEALKVVHQNQWVQKLFGAVEKISRLVYCIKWRVLWRWLKFKHVQINTQLFMNKFQFWGVPLPILWLIVYQVIYFLLRTNSFLFLMSQGKEPLLGLEP